MKIQSPLIATLGLLACIVFRSMASAQLFTPVTAGPVVTDASGSRSVNFLDLNNDDYQDLLITNGKSGGEDNLLYLNNRDGSFTLLNDTVCRDGDPSDGATCGDYDNDGFIDLYVVNWYNVNNLLYHNEGTGAFSRVVTGVVPIGGGYSETAAWGDYDNDGLLDLYVTNSGGIFRNFLYRNLGSGAFQKINAISPVTDGFQSRCVNWIDMDRDGDQDLFVTNESSQQNNLYRNDGGGVFTKVTSGPLVQSAFSSMSSSWADFDNDGDFDVVIANYEQPNQLFLNDGSGQFTQVANPFSPEIGCSFGSSFADYDNDGDIDIFIANGYCANNLNNYLYENNGDGTFTRNTTEPIATDLGASFGSAWADYDNDGFMDLAVANWQNDNQPNYLYHNNGNGNNWVKLRLTGTVSNRSAIGTVLRCKAVINGNPIWQMRDVSSQTGYCSQNSLVVHFGLGDATVVDSIQVIWPSGIVQEFGNVDPGHLYSLLENGGITIVGLDIPIENAPRLEVYPNPSGGEMIIEMEAKGNGPLQIEVLDLLGRTVMREHRSRAKGNVRLPVSLKCLAGQYLLRIREGAGPDLTRRIVILE